MTVIQGQFVHELQHVDIFIKITRTTKGTINSRNKKRKWGEDSQETRAFWVGLKWHEINKFGIIKIIKLKIKNMCSKRKPQN